MTGTGYHTLSYVCAEGPGLVLTLQAFYPSNHIPSPCKTLKKYPTGVGSGEKTQWLKALAAFAEDPALIISTHMVVHSNL